LEDYLNIITASLRRHLVFPDEAIAHGFNQILDEESFQELEYDDASNNIGSISAIDGGSNTIIKTPTSALVFNRVYCNKFVKMSKLKEYELCTFASFTEIVEEDGKSFFKTSIYPLKGNCSMEPIKIKMDEYKIGKLKGDLDRALSVARRFAEWDFIEKALDTGSEFVLMDGALQTAFAEESHKASRLYKQAVSKGAMVVGLSKSNTIYTDENCIPIAGFLDSIAERKKFTKWYIKLGNSEEWAHEANVFYIRLHEGADRAFRLDVFEGADEMTTKRLLIALQANSKYFAFPGFPYALIDAHIYANVKDEEVKYIKDLILDKLDLEDVKKLERMERALMSHDVLDMLGG
jgi:hypothetical protein